LLFGGIKLIRRTTPWLSHASWTWEILRRRPNYIAYYNSLKNKAFDTRLIAKDVTLYSANTRFPTANKFGLLAPADPAKYAGDQPVFWCPKAFNNVVRFYVIDDCDVGRKKKPMQLSKISGEKTHFLDADGTYHIRVLGARYWFQLQCDNTDMVADDAYIGFAMNHTENPDKRLETIKLLGGIYDGTIDVNDRLHVPARLDSHQKSTLAYDIRTAGGSITDVISALIEAELVTDDPDKFVDFKDVAQNAYRAGKAYITGDYLKILNRQ